ncbi:MAG: trigger factor [Synergistaceae bacterium]|nr:trigger factor [Synergistaceae bacterium]
MKSEIISQENNVVVVKTEHEAGEVDKAVNRTIRDFSNKANIKGFRKGHVPRKTLELFMGKNVIYKETLERLANEALEAVVNGYEIDMIAEPKFKLGDLAEGKPLEIEFTLEARPEVELPDISSLVAVKKIYNVHDSDVEAGLRQVLESNARVEPTDEDRPAQASDIVEVEYTSYVERAGTTHAVERDRKNTFFLSSLRDDIAGAIIGHGPGEELSFDIVLEDDYPDPKIAGHTVHYELKILNLMRRILPEMNDETVSEISRGKYRTVDELKSDIRRQLEEDASAHSEAGLLQSALEALVKNAKVDVPDGMVDRQYSAMRREQDGQLMRDLSQSLDDYLANNNLSVDEFDGRLRKKAEETVRSTLVLNALADRDEILYTSDDINAEIMSMAAALRVNAQQLADSLGKNTQEFTNVVSRVRTKNTMKHLASLVSVVEYEEDYNAAHGHGHEEEAGAEPHAHDEGDAEQ